MSSKNLVSTSLSDATPRHATGPDAVCTHVFVFIGLYRPSYGGMENHGRYLVDWLRRSPPGFVLGSVFAKDEYGATVELDEHGCVVHSWTDPVALSAAIKARTATHPQAMFFNTSHWIEDLEQLRLNLPMTLFCARTGGNEIVQAPLHTLRTSHHQRQQFWAETINRHIDVLVTNSAFTERRLVQMGIEPGKCVRVPGGVDEALADRCAQQRLERAGAAKRIVWAGRFVAFKGIEVLVDAMRQLDDQSVELVLIGDGPLLPSVREQVRRLNLDKRVHLHGALTPQQSLQAIAEADVYVAPSLAEVRKVAGGSYIHTETMGRSVMEALSCGLRVVASRVGGLPEIVDGDVGELVLAGDPRAVANAIMRQLALPALGEAYRRRLAARFSWSAVFGTYRAIWSRVYA